MTTPAFAALTTALSAFIEKYRGHTFDAEFDISTALHEYMDLEHDLPSQVIGPCDTLSHSTRYSIDAEVFYVVFVYNGKLTASVHTMQVDKCLCLLEVV